MLDRKAWPQNMAQDSDFDSHVAQVGDADTLGHVMSSSSIAIAAGGAASLVVASAIDAAPAYTGQIAVAGGKIYIALAHAAAGDWKELTLAGV